MQADGGMKGEPGLPGSPPMDRLHLAVRELHRTLLLKNHHVYFYLALGKEDYFTGVVKVLLTARLFSWKDQSFRDLPLFEIDTSSKATSTGRWNCYLDILNELDEPGSISDRNFILKRVATVKRFQLKSKARKEGCKP